MVIAAVVHVHTALQVEEGVYILDFNPCVLTAAQAFAAALSTFETKYLL